MCTRTYWEVSLNEKYRVKKEHDRLGMGDSK